MLGKDPDRRLLQVVDEAMSEAAARAGDRLACRPGCTECCHGPFPINELDAEEIDACRVEPDPHGVEDRLVDRFQAADETLIAFALSGR